MKKNLLFMIFVAFLLPTKSSSNILLTRSTKFILSTTFRNTNKQQLFNRLILYQKRNFIDPATVALGTSYIIGYTSLGEAIIATAEALVWVGGSLYLLWQICNGYECRTEVQDTGRRDYSRHLRQAHRHFSHQNNNQNIPQHRPTPSHNNKNSNKNNKRPDYKEKKVEAAKFMNACKKDKKNYHWDQEQEVLITNKNNRPKFDGKEVGAYHTDKLHGEIEVYDKNGNWIGAMDPSTGKPIPKPANSNAYLRKVRLS